MRRQKKRLQRYRKIQKKMTGEGKAKNIWLILGGIFGIVFLLYVCIALYFIGHFYINTKINGVDFSGKSVKKVEEYMEQQVKNYELKIVEQGNESETIKGDEISLKYKANAEIKSALKKQLPFLWPSAFFSQNATQITIEVQYDENKLSTKIQSLEAVLSEQKEPVSAYPKFDGELFVVEPEVYGTKVDLVILEEKIKQSIEQLKGELNMMEEECYIMPEYTSESLEVQKACDNLNEYLKASITYKMDTDVTVDKSLIATWLTWNDKMEVSIDETKVKEWMNEFCSTYDSIGKIRSITTPTGKTASVSGGTYGWSVDEPEEIRKLIENIKSGERVEREPVYEKTAASHSQQDWGDTYVEVDLSTQHMWYIVNGSVQLETDVVTGLASDPNRATPSGVYSILEMKRDKVLTGETNPSTGEPIYRTKVSYWMRVTWTGIGFHDAIWQSAFGGNRYQTLAGSHGCINMPLDQAASLYDMLEMGTPVVIHE